MVAESVLPQRVSIQLRLQGTTLPKGDDVASCMTFHRWCQHELRITIIDEDYRIHVKSGKCTLVRYAMVCISTCSIKVLLLGISVIGSAIIKAF